MPAHLRVSRPAKRRISGIQPNPDDLALSPWSSEHHKRYPAQPNSDAIVTKWRRRRGSMPRVEVLQALLWIGIWLIICKLYAIPNASGTKLGPNPRIGQALQEVSHRLEDWRRSAIPRGFQRKRCCVRFGEVWNPTGVKVETSDKCACCRSFETAPSEFIERQVPSRFVRCETCVVST